ncbi:MAG: hypothetical protein MZU95_04075 [Desulfomicrobium escambiense]|nr:hypothetical protein [Desulfomicrobium escambiense]
MENYKGDLMSGINGLFAGMSAINYRYQGQGQVLNSTQGMLKMLGNPSAHTPEQALAIEKNLMAEKLLGETMAKAADVMEKIRKLTLNLPFKNFNFFYSL